VLALDVGGSTIKGGVLSAGGRLRGEERWSTRRGAGLAAVLAAIDAAADELAGAHPGASALGLAVPGNVDRRTGVARRSTTLDWHDVPFGARLGTRLRLPIAVLNDVRAGGLAEQRLGAARGSRDVMFVALGTGIAAAIISGGQMLDGARAAAGELGHLVVEPDGRPCTCGRRGCLETVASGRALAAHDPDGAAGVVRRAAAGDSAAAAVWDAAVAALATGLAACVMLLDPERIVLGGGIAHAGPALRDPLREQLGRRLAGAVPELRLAELRDLAGCIGAGLAAFEDRGVQVRP
jgi:glucokinase